MRAVTAALLGLLSLTGLAPTPAAATTSADVRLALATTTPPVLPDGPFTVHLRVEGAPDPDQLAVRVGVHPCICNRGRRTFTRGLDGSGLGSPLRQPRSLPLDSLPRAPDGTVTLTLPSNELGLRSSAAVYPVSIALDGPGGEIDRLLTHLVRLPSGADLDAAPLWVAWVQPFDAPPALRPDGKVDLGRDGDELAALADVLAASDVPMTLAPSPETLDALAAERPAVTDALRQAVRRRPVLTRPYVDVDVDGLIGAGLGGEVIAARDRGGVARLGSLPDAAVDDRTWSADEHLGPLGATALRLLPVTRFVVPEDRLEPRDPTPRFTPTAPFLLEGDGAAPLPAVALDTGLAAHLEDGEDPVLAADHLLADLSVIYLDAPGFTQRGVVVRPPPGRPTSAPLVRAALAGLAGNPLLRAVPLNTLFGGVAPEEAGGEPVTRRLAPLAEPPSRPDAVRLRQLRGSAASLEQLAGPLDPDVDLVRRLLLVSSSASLDDARRTAYLRGAAARVAARTDSVGLVDPGGFRLTAQEGTIPLTLTASPPFPLRVCLRLTSDKLDFLDSTEGSPPGRYDRPLTLQAENTPVEVRVRARTPGAFPLNVDVRSCDGQLRLGASRVTVRATAPSGVGVVLSGGAGAFLLVWWARHWRTVRRRRRLVATPAAG